MQRLAKPQPIEEAPREVARRSLEVLGSLLVLLMLLVPALLVGMYLHHLSAGSAGMSYTNVDPMLFRMTGLG